MDAHVAQKLADLSARSERERRRFYARRPKGVADILAKVMAKQGYAASKGAGLVNTAWVEAARSVLGEDGLAAQTRVKALSRGTLEVLVANHVVMQEINFHRPQLLKAVQQALPESKINAVRFKVGRI